MSCFVHSDIEDDDDDDDEDYQSFVESLKHVLAAAGRRHKL